MNALMKKLYIVLILTTQAGAMEKFHGLLFALRHRCRSVVPVEAFSCTYDHLRKTIGDCLECFKCAMTPRQRNEAEKCLIDLLPAAFTILPPEELEEIHRRLVPHLQAKYRGDPLYSPEMLSLYAAQVADRTEMDHKFIVSLVPEGKEADVNDSSKKLLAFLASCRLKK